MSFHSEQKELCEIEKNFPERMREESRCQAGLRSSVTIYSIIRTRQHSGKMKTPINLGAGSVKWLAGNSFPSLKTKAQCDRTLLQKGTPSL